MAKKKEETALAVIVKDPEPKALVTFPNQSVATVRPDGKLWHVLNAYGAEVEVEMADTKIMSAVCGLDKGMKCEPIFTRMPDKDRRGVPIHQAVRTYRFIERLLCPLPQQVGP